MLKAVNWNKLEDDYSLTFWNQNVMQIWTDKEIPLANDQMVWMKLSKEEQETYMKVLGGLTLLDTMQGDDGMPNIGKHVEGLQRKAVLSVMGFMEHMHAKSYSSIFTTLASNEQIDSLFAWIHKHLTLQEKSSIILDCYTNIKSKKDLYVAMAASVALESFLFYSGFFYPLYLAGQGKMTASGEIIDLILRDESIHGLYVGMLAQEIFSELSPNEQDEVQEKVYNLFRILYQLEIKYTTELYKNVGLVDEVTNFVIYNGQKALMNLGVNYTVVFPNEVQVNPIVLNGINTQTKHHDFFSKKGNGYVKALNVHPLTDEDFVFPNL